MKPFHFFIFLILCIGYALYFGDPQKEAKPGVNFCSKEVFNSEDASTVKYPSIYSRLFLGCKLKKMDPEEKEALALFYRTGTGHLLSIAGLHLGGVSVLLYFLFNLIFYCCSWSKKRTYIPFCKVSLVLSVVLTFSYVLFIGIELPRARAILMILLSMASFIFVILRDKIVVLALSASIILVVAPNSIYSLSFYYSFMCVLGVFLSPSKKSINLCMVIFLFILPLNLYASGDLDVSSIISNFVMIPLFVFLYFPLQLLFFGLLVMGYHRVTVLMDTITTFIIRLLNLCDISVGWLRLRTLPLTMIEVFILYVLLFTSMIILFYRGKWTKKIAVFIYIVLSVMAIFYGTYFYFKYGILEYSVTVFNISKPRGYNGSGDLIFIRTGKNNILFDTGYGDYSVKKAIMDIQRLKISTVDYLILSHTDLDHVGGLEYVLKESGLNIKKILVSPCMYLNKKKLPLTQHIYEVCDNSELVLDSQSKISFMSPSCTERKKCSNDAALMFLLRTVGHDILFSSDTPAKKLESIFNKKGYSDLTNTLIQLPHHCSSREYPQGLFDHSRPLLAFCTRNETLLKSGVSPSEYEFPVFMTGRCGSLDITLRKEKIKISSQRCSKVYNFI